jgi:zinc transport system permease protein
MMEILQYQFMQNAVAGAVLASILCGIVGTYIVVRRLVFISGGITHASFGGIGLGLYAGINPILSAMVFAVACSCGVKWMSKMHEVREDSAIAVVWTLGMSLGIIFCFLTPGIIPDLPSYLFGSILTTTRSDLMILAVLTLIAILLFITLHHEILSISFDADFARSQRLPVTFIEYVMMILIALTIVASLRIVGIVLAISLLTIPQMTASIFTGSFDRMMLYSCVIGIIDSLIGLSLSYWLNVPSGATIIFTSIIIYVLSKAIKSLFRVLYK